MTPTTRRAGRVLAVAAAVAASAFIWHDLPSNSAIYAPFEVQGTAAERVSGHAITATVTGVRIAAVLNTPKPVAAIGRWVVVDIEIEPGDTVEYPHAELAVGSDTYAPTDRLPPGAELGQALQPGIRTRGSWVFDVDPSLLDARAPLTVRLWVGDGRLDSRLAIAIDPGAAVGMQTAQVARPDRAAS